MPKQDGGKGKRKGGKKSKKGAYRKCLGECYPKGTCPPFYSYDDDDGMEWQMSPFSKERFDLNEIQILEKKGVKAKAQLEALKRKLAGEDSGEECGGTSSAVSPTPVPPKMMSGPSRPMPAMQKNCSMDVLYQPYGPLSAPLTSFTQPSGLARSPYCYLGPSIYATGIPKPPLLPMGVMDFDSGPMGSGATFSKRCGGTYMPLGP